jgi:hypothetical protein
MPSSNVAEATDESYLGPQKICVSSFCQSANVLLYFPAYKTHPDFFLLEIKKQNDDCILILVKCWKKTGLLHMKISNYNINCSS